MKIRNKILSVVMTVAMGLSLVSANVFAENTVKIGLSAEKTTVAPGEEFTVNVNITENPGFLYIKLKTDADSNFTMTGFADTSLVPEGQNGGKNYKNGYAFYWDCSLEDADITATGNVATLTYKVNDNAPAGTYTISVVDGGGGYNYEDDDVAVTTGSISITVAGNEPKADYYAATLTWGEKAKANTGVKFNFSDSTDNKNKYAKVPFGDVTFEADSDVTVAVEVKNAPAGALTFTGAEWYLD